MRIKFIEKLKFKMAGRSVPVMRASEINWVGKVGTLRDFGECKDRPNSIIDTYEAKGWEKQGDTSPITFIDRKGQPSQLWIVGENGETINLYTRPTDFPNREDVIGRAATMDDISDAMDLGKSVRNILIGAIISAPAWWIIFQVLGQMMA